MTDTRIVTAPRVRPIFQIAAGDVDVVVGQARYDDAHYDVYPEATYAGLDAEWTDDGCDVIDAVTWLGRQRSADVFDVGTATVTVRNPDGLWDFPPTDPSTPLSIRPGRMARIGVSIDASAPAWLFTGWIDATRPAYTPSGNDTVVVDVVCAKGQFGRVDLPRVVAAVGANESVTARMTRYADAAMFPAHRRQFEASGITLIGTSLGGRAGELADGSATSAGGDVFGDEAGRLRYATSGWQAYAIDDGPTAAIGNRGIDGEVCPNLWDISFARSDFTTRVNYGRSGEAPATIDDTANRDLYGVETWDMTSMETVDTATMANLAARALRVRSFDLAPRIEAVTLDAGRAGAADLMATASPFTPTLYACGLVQKGRPVFARTMYVTGVAHTITAGNWTARLALDDASPWATPSNARYDTARYDQDRYSIAV